MSEPEMILACRSFSVRHLAIAVAMSFAALFCVANAGAQASRVGAILEDTVRDGSGAAESGPKATVRNTFTSESRTVTTDEQGRFRAEQLADGTCAVQVEQRGFASYRRAEVQ